MPGERALSVVIVGRRLRRARGGDRAAPARVRRRDRARAGARASAGPGTTTTTRGVPATSRATCTRSRSRSAATGRGSARRRRRSSGIWRRSRGTTGSIGLVRHGVDVVSCRWDDARRRGRWRRADGRTWRADAVVIATGQLHQPSIPRRRGSRRVRGCELSLGPLGSLLRPDREAGGGDRDGRERGPVRAGGRGRRGGCTCSSGPATGSCRGATAPTRRWCARRSGTCPGCRRSAGGSSTTTPRR